MRRSMPSSGPSPRPQTTKLQRAPAPPKDPPPSTSPPPASPIRGGSGPRRGSVTGRSGPEGGLLAIDGNEKMIE